MSVDGSDHLFKDKTNLPSSVRMQIGARDMYLNNSQMQHNVCNGTIGIITDVDVDADQVRVVFSSRSSLVDAVVSRITVKFVLNGLPASRTQFPLQNAFALTVHKKHKV